MPTAGGGRWRLTAALAGVLLLAGCTLGEAAAPREEDKPDHRVGPVSCKRLGHAEVLGSRPAYAKGPLASFPNSRTVCGGIWLEGAEKRFAPQGLALDGQTAWVSGWLQTSSDGFKECRLLKVDLRTGRTLTEQQGVQGQGGRQRLGPARPAVEVPALAGGDMTSRSDAGNKLPGETSCARGKWRRSACR